MPGRHRQPSGRHRPPRRHVARVALAGLLVAAAPVAVLAAIAQPEPAPSTPAGASSTSTTAPPVTAAAPPTPTPPVPPVATVLSCAAFPDVDAAQRALDGDLGLAPLLDTDRDGQACEARWPRTPLDAAGDAVEDVVDDVVDTLTGSCAETGFNGVADHVAVVGHHLEARFLLGQILGVGSRAANPNSDHPRGLALDLFAGRVVGDQLAAYVLERRAEFGVTYVIFRQRINYGDGWEPMEDRGGATANHQDHVHVSFKPGVDPPALSC